MKRQAEVFDIGIVGGGPAGLSAGIWSARYQHSVVLIDSGDPRNWEARGVNGYLGLPSVKPSALRGRGRDECVRLGVKMIDNEVLRAELHKDDTVALHLRGGASIRVRRLLLTIGMRDVWPDVPGLEQVYGANAHVCPDCDGLDASGCNVVVIGDGRSAVGMALALSTWTQNIIICTNGRRADMNDHELREKLDSNNITVLTDVITRITREGDQIVSLDLANGMSLDAEKIFFTYAQYPADDLGAQLKCKRDRGGHIIVSDHFATSVRSVFAAGDITPGPQLAVRAASGGAVAAMSMHKSLLPEHRKLS